MTYKKIRIRTILKQVQTLNAIRKYLCLVLNSDVVQSTDIRQAKSDDVQRCPATSGDARRRPATSGDIWQRPATSSQIQQHLENVGRRPENVWQHQTTSGDVRWRLATSSYVRPHLAFRQVYFIRYTAYLFYNQLIYVRRRLTSLTTSIDAWRHPATFSDIWPCP